MAFIVIGYYTTDTLYKRQARKLRKTLDKFKLNHDLTPIKPGDSWVHNCARKAEVVLNAFDEHNEDILYLDVDARVMKYPVLFDDFPGHFGVHFREDVELVSNTMFFKNCDICRALVDLWGQEQLRQPEEWDQRVLQQVLGVITHAVPEFQVINLPKEYSHMEGIYEWHPGVVIKQIQISREVRRRPDLVLK